MTTTAQSIYEEGKGWMDYSPPDAMRQQAHAEHPQRQLIDSLRAFIEHLEENSIEHGRLCIGDFYVWYDNSHLSSSAALEKLRASGSAPIAFCGMERPHDHR